MITRRRSEVNLKKKREQLNLSQRAFAEMLGVSVRTYIRWEMGHGAPPRIVELYLAKRARRLTS
jgi:DNA-binding transcriptional regulator YiaG